MTDVKVVENVVTAVTVSVVVVACSCTVVVIFCCRVESCANDCCASDSSAARSCLSAMASKATIVGTMNRIMLSVRQMTVDSRPFPGGCRIVNAMDKFG